jgi:hypothetical protein
MSNLYNYSASGTYRHDAATGAELMQGPPIVGRSVLKPALASVANIFMSGLPATLSNYVPSLGEAARIWDTNMVSLKGNDLSVNGVGGKINVLPTGTTQFINYEDATPERRRVYTTATTKTYGSNKVTFSVSSTDIYLFRKETIIKNWTNSETKHGFVIDVDYTALTVQIQALAGESALTAVTDFFVSDSSLDEIERIGTSIDVFNPSSYPSDLIHRPFRDLGSSNIKVYNTQYMEDTWEVTKFHDANYRAFSGDKPRATRTAEDAVFQHFSQLESQLLWGKAFNMNNNSRMGCNGIYNSISTNVTTVTGGGLSLDDIDTVLVDQLGGTQSSTDLIGLCSFKTLMIVEQLFANLAKSYHCTLEKVWSGMYMAPINVISYRNRRIFLFPVSNMSQPTFSTRAFGDPATVAAYGTKLILVDPAAVMTVTACPENNQPDLFNVEKNIEAPEETKFLSRNRISSYIGFALKHEKTSAVINGIRTADLQG